MLRRDIAVVPDPRDHPREAADAERDKRAAPRDDVDEHDDHQRRDGVTDAGERVRETLSEPAPLGRHPALHGSGRDGERRAFTDSQQQTDQI